MIAEKACSQCRHTKPRTLDHFAPDARKADGLRRDCRACHSARAREWYRHNRERAIANRAAYRASNPDKIVALARSRAIGVSAKLGWAVQDREAERTRERERRRASIQDRLARRARERVRRHLRAHGVTERASFSLGCTPTALVAHIEAQFGPGMTWENRGQWEVDHILPLAAFDLTDPRQRAWACHYTNLQPLWSAENRAKWHKLEPAVLAELEAWKAAA